MKMGKKIGLTLICLCILTVLCMGGIWKTDKKRDGLDRIENETQNREAISQSVEGTTEITQAQEAVRINETIEGSLMDFEDYSQAPASNGSPYYIKVNRLQNVVTVYALDENGYYTRPVRAMVCSVGMNGGTPTGTFTTEDKYPWRSLVGGVYGQYAYRIEGHIMFHSVPYYTMNKGDLESEEYNKLGEAASLGCVRLSVIDAKWIYENCPEGTLVKIYDSVYAGPLGKPVAEQLNLEDERSGWDPTDLDAANPWNVEGVRIVGGGSMTLERGCTYSLTDGIHALDENGNDITSQMIVENDVNIMAAGDYSVTYRVVSESGKEASVTYPVRVIDTIPPELSVAEGRILLNHSDAAEHNITDALCRNITVQDLGSPLSKSCIQMDLSALEGQTCGRYSVRIWAEDMAGNRSDEQTITVYLDREAPTISQPEKTEFAGATEEEIRKQLEAAIPIQDNYSGVEQRHFSWVERADGTCTLLVTAKDGYGNVSSKFFDDLIISCESSE